MTLAARLIAERESQLLTQVQLASIAGVSQQLIDALEHERYAGTAKMVQIARALGVLAEWLESGQGPKSLAEYAASIKAGTGQPEPSQLSRTDIGNIVDAVRVALSEGSAITSESFAYAYKLVTALPRQTTAATPAPAVQANGKGKSDGTKRRRSEGAGSAAGRPNGRRKA